MAPPITDSRPEFVSINELSAETGITAATLRYWRGENSGPASFKLGGRVVYRRSEVDRWLSEQEAATRRGGGGDAL
nr:helix-turn-helix domain-containing protein [uncultured Rhodococcus sp.]